MKVLIFLLLALAATASAQNRTPSRDTVTVSVDRIDSVVYVTKQGKKYHRETCQHLNESRKAITVSEAKSANYEPCKRCYKDSTQK